MANEEKRELEVKEIIARFQASIFTMGAYLKKEGKIEILDRVNDFSIYEKHGNKSKKIKKEDKKLPEVGSFERLMGLFNKK